jgi:hypothetical protein
MSYRVIRASEIGEYVYCRRAWWLRRLQGVESANVRELAAGIAHHRGHGHAVRLALLARRVALMLLFLAVAFFAFWIASLP